MRRVAKWIPAVLIAVVACLVVSVSVQKGTPVTYVWQATLPTYADSMDVYGPDSYTFTAVLGSTAGVSYIPPNPHNGAG